MIRFFDGLLPRFPEVLYRGTRIVPASTTATFQFWIDLAVKRIPEKHEFTLGILSVSERLLAIEPIVHVTVDGRKDRDRLAMLFANETDQTFLKINLVPLQAQEGALTVADVIT